MIRNWTLSIFLLIASCAQVPSQMLSDEIKYSDCRGQTDGIAVISADSIQLVCIKGELDQLLQKQIENTQLTVNKDLYVVVDSVGGNVFYSMKIANW